jgi:hypothetical protein
LNIGIFQISTFFESQKSENKYNRKVNQKEKIKGKIEKETKKAYLGRPTTAHIGITMSFPLDRLGREQAQ